jgi:arylsulfatase A
MKRILTIGLGLVLITAVSTSAAPETPAPTNVLLIMIDDMGWMDLACQGNKRVDTPNIDRFAKQGMRFTDAYAAAPVCSPTRGALITGLAPARLKITQHGIDGKRFVPKNATITPGPSLARLAYSHTTLAERLKAKGYSTAFLGKWHLSDESKQNAPNTKEADYRPQFHGFDINIGGCGFGGPPTYWDPYRIPSLKNRKEGEYLSYRLADETITYMRSVKDKPFFICLWPYNVHYPFEAPKELAKKYESRLGLGLKNAIYGGQIEATDIAIGRVLNELDKLKLADNTLVIFTSDNGGWSGAADNRPLREGKGYLYEGGIRVPQMIRWPGVTKAATESNTPVISMDLTATILDATGTKLKDGETLDGESLRPLLARTGTLKRDAIYFHYPHWAFHKRNRPGSAIRSGKYKLIEYFDDDSVELYDLEADLSEKKDLAKELPNTAADLKAKLDAWQAETKASIPTKVSKTPK